MHVNPRHMGEGMVVVLCLSINMLVSIDVNKLHIGILRLMAFSIWVASIENALFKLLMIFADNFCLLCSLASSQWTKESVMAFFFEKTCVDLVDGSYNLTDLSSRSW